MNANQSVEMVRRSLDQTPSPPRTEPVTSKNSPTSVFKPMSTRRSANNSGNHRLTPSANAADLVSLKQTPVVLRGQPSQTNSQAYANTSY